MQQETSLTEHLPPAQSQRLRQWWRDYHIQMLSAKGWDNEKGWQIPWRRVNDVFFLMPTFGEVEVHLDDGLDVTRFGRVLILGPNVHHHLRLKAGYPRLFQLALHCHIQDSTGLAMDLSQLPPCIDVKYPHKVEAQWRLVTHAMNTDRDWGTQLGELFVRELWQEVLQQFPDIPLQAGPTDGRVRDALITIHRHYSQPLSVEDLAERVSLRPVHFRRLFKRDTGSSPKVYIANFRLQLAQHLLRHTHLNVKQIADQVGFDTDMYFHLCFKKRFGMTPLQYRATRSEL